eukprot:scaffold231562_cov54-Attheya_sp.AAC.1
MRQFGKGFDQLLEHLICALVDSVVFLHCPIRQRDVNDTTEMNQAAVIYALLFKRAFLYAVNRKGPLSARGRIWMIWSECNCILSVHQGGVYCNKMKLLMGAMPLCFLAIYDLVDLFALLRNR